MSENEKINGWTFEETIQCAENLMEEEKDIFKWDVLRHLRDFAENYKEEIQQYRAIRTIEELQDLKDAEEQGLLLRLPCKVGDVVYFPIYDYHDSAIIETIRIEENGVFYDWVQYEVGVDCTEVWDNGSFADGNIGKTVFLTREEAEQALAEMQET